MYFIVKSDNVGEKRMLVLATDGFILLRVRFLPYPIFIANTFQRPILPAAHIPEPDIRTWKYVQLNK